MIESFTSSDTLRPVLVEIQEVSKKFLIRNDKSVKERLLHPRASRQHQKEFWALDKVSLDIEAGTTVGLIGPNGSGKSTLLKTIGNIIEPTSGVVRTRGRLAALLELGAGFHPDLSGRENVFLNASILGMTQEETERQFEAIVEFSGIRPFIDTQVKFYSSGMYVRLAFAVAIHVDPDILLVDEVLAVGDEAFQKKCLNKIKEFQEEGRTIILVSHSLQQISDLCTRAVVLGNGSVVFDGGPKDAVSILRAGYKTRAEAEAAKSELEKAQQEEAELERLANLVEVVDSVVKVDGVENAEVITPGADLEVDVTLRFKERLEGWDLVASLLNSLGTMVTATSTGSTGSQNLVGEGDVSVKFHMPALNLGSGTYSIVLSMHDSKRRSLFVKDDVAQISSKPSARSVGPVYTEAQTHVSQL